MTGIHEAVSKGEVREVRRLLDAGVDVEMYNAAGQTALMSACVAEGASVEMVRILLYHGANPNGLTRAEAVTADFDPLPGVQGIPEVAGLFDQMPEILRSVQELKAKLQTTEPERKCVLSIAAGSASMEKLRLLLERGADPTCRSAGGYTPVIHAACAGRMEVIELLIAAGGSADGVTSYGESALSVISRRGEFGHVARLLELGADPAPLEWTRLHRAAALGGADEMVALLDAGEDLEARDFWERTPLLLAIHAGRIENAALLLQRGADRAATGRCGRPAIHFSIDGDDTAMLRWLLAQGYSIEGMNEFKETALMHAVEHGSPNCFEALLDAGADWRGTDKFGKTLIANATHPEIIRRLIELGLSAQAMEDPVLRDWIGLGNHDDLPVTEAEFHAGRTRRFGSANPERMDVPFWNAMVRCGWGAFQAANRFGHDSFGLHDPVWCHERFGMSLTPLPDGRWVQIAGEHEDGYDPDFCIYNDVIIHDGHGGFQIFGYPAEIFPPTDFHSATLVGKWIYLIGNLGYPETRIAFGYETPVFRLHIGDWHIERVATQGESPGWIHTHEAERAGDCIRVFQGKRGFFKDGGEEIEEFTGSYELNLTSGAWRER